MYYSQDLLVPIWPGLALYIRSWDFGAALPQLSRLQQPFTRFSWRKLSSSFCSAGDRGNVQEQGSSVPGERSMAWSHTFHGGSSSKASLEKTSLKLWYWSGTMSLRDLLTSAFR